ncbi:hypothetical protein PTKIN_Ptkin03bG0196300 [Pterospermum kingtungense]
MNFVDKLLGARLQQKLLLARLLVLMSFQLWRIFIRRKKTVEDRYHGQKLTMQTFASNGGSDLEGSVSKGSSDGKCNSMHSDSEDDKLHEFAADSIKDDDDDYSGRKDGDDNNHSDSVNSADAKEILGNEKHEKDVSLQSHSSKRLAGIAIHPDAGTGNLGTKNRLRQRPVIKSALDSVVPDSEDDISLDNTESGTSGPENSPRDAVVEELIMAEELDVLWKVLRLTEDEEENIETADDTNESRLGKGKTWLIGKLLTTRPFNKDAMMATMKIIWKLSQEVEIVALEENLFLFKFQRDWRPEEYVFEKASFWIRIYNLPLGMRNTNIAKRIGMRVEIDITKPLRRTVKLAGGEGRKDAWGRIAYERLPTFCYCFGLLGHIDTDCAAKIEGTDDNQETHHYGDWLRASPLKKGLTFNKKLSSSARTEEFLAQMKTKTDGMSRTGNCPPARGGCLARCLTLEDNDSSLKGNSLYSYIINKQTPRG